MNQTSPPNRCGQCGATSYRPVIARDSQGAMRPSRTYKCSGCSLVFTQLSSWRAGAAPGVIAHPNGVAAANFVR